MPRVRSSDDEISDSTAVRKLKNAATNVSSPLRRSSRIKEIKEYSPKQLRGRTVRAASECSSPATKVTRRTRASSVDPDEVASPVKPKRRVAVTPLKEEPDEINIIKATTRKKTAVGKTTKPKENLDSSKESTKGTRKTKKTKDLDSSKESAEAERRDEEHSTKSDEKSNGKKKVLKSFNKSSSTEKEIRIVLERVLIDNQVENESLKNTEINDEPSYKDEIADIVSLDGSVSSSGIGSILESDLGRRKQHFDFNEDIREKSKKLIEKYKIPLKGVEVIEISGPDTDAEVIVDEDDEDQVLKKDYKLNIPIYHSTLLCDKNNTDNFRKLFVKGSSPVAGTEDNSKEEKTERPKTPLDNVIEIAESDEELFSPTRTAIKKSDPPVVEPDETIEKLPSETDPVEKSEELQLSSQDSVQLCLEEKNTVDEVEVSQKETPVQLDPSRRKSVTFALRESSQETNDEDDFDNRMNNFFNNRTPARKFGEQSLFDSTAVVDESEPMDHEDITSPEKSLKIGREDENKLEEVQAEKDNSVVNEKDETLGDISRKATKDSDSESLNSSFEIDESKSEKNVQKASEDSDDTSVKDSEKGEQSNLNRSRKSIGKERRSLTKIDPNVEEIENDSDEKIESLNKSKMDEASVLNESRKSMVRTRKSSSKMVLVDSEDSVDDLLDKAVNKSLNKSKEDRQSLSNSIQEEIQSRRMSSEKESSKPESPQKRSHSRNSINVVSSDEEEDEVSKLNKSKQEEPAKDSQTEEIVLSSDKHSSDEKEDEEKKEEMDVDEETVQSMSNANEIEEEVSPSFSPLEGSSDDEIAIPKERKSLNTSLTNKAEETEDPKARKSLNQSQKSEISRKSLEMEKENIENDKGNKNLDTPEKKSLNKSVQIESVNEDLESVSKSKNTVTPQKRQSLQMEEHDTLDKSRKSLNEIKALKEVLNSPIKERKSLQFSVKDISQKVELNESIKSRKSLDAEKQKKARESLEKSQSMDVDSEEEDEESEVKSVKTRKSLNQSKVEIELDPSKSRQSLKKQSMDEDSEEQEEQKEKSVKIRKSLNQSKDEKELNTSKSRQSLGKQSMDVDSEEEKEPKEKSIKTRKSLNQSKVEIELDSSTSRQSLKKQYMEEDSEEEEELKEKSVKTRKSLDQSKDEKELNTSKSSNSSKRVDKEEADLSKTRKSLNQSKKSEEKFETSSRKSLNMSKKNDKDTNRSTNIDKSLDKSQDYESNEEDQPEEESDLNDTYNNFLKAVVTAKPLAIDSEDESVSIDEKDLDKTSSEDDDLDDEEEEPLDSQDKDAGDIDQSGVRRVKKSLEADFKINESANANKSVNKSTERQAKNDPKAKIPTFLYSASESEDDTQDEMDADILKEYNLDGETIVEYSDDDVIADDIRASETESSEDEDDSDLDDFIVDEVSEEEEEEDDEEQVDDEEEDGEDEDGENEYEEEKIEEEQTESEEKKIEVLEKSVEKKRKSDVAKIDEAGKSRQSIGNNTMIEMKSEDEENEVMNYNDSCIIEQNTKSGKPLIKSILSTRVQMSTPNADNKASRISKSFENVSALDSTLLVADVDTSESKKSKSRKSESRKSLHQSLPLPQESSPEKEQLRVRSNLSKTLSTEGSETPVTKHLKKAKMNETEPIIKLPDESFKKSEKKKKKKKKNNNKKSLGEVMNDIIDTEVPTTKINDESLNKSSKKRKDSTIVEEKADEAEAVEEVKTKNKKFKNKTDEVVEKKEKSKKKTVLEMKDVEVPSRYNTESDKSENKQVLKKANKKKQMEVLSEDTLNEEKPKKTKKRAAETEMAVQSKRKRNESEESEKVAKSSKNKQTEVATLKRRRDDLSASFSEVRTKKRQRTDDVKIVASSSGSTTVFEVVPITKHKSKAPKALQSYRQRLLSRYPTQSASAYANYQLKLKASGKNKF